MNISNLLSGENAQKKKHAEYIPEQCKRL